LFGLSEGRVDENGRPFTRFRIENCKIEAPPETHEDSEIENWDL
jgi:hypothetical protein